MRKALALVVALGVVFGTRSAQADESVCKEVYEQSQELMNAKEGELSLFKARERLRTCMRAECASWIVADCSKWLVEVEQRIPTIVFSARNTAGRDLTDVRVTTESGEPIVGKLDGRAIESEPGERVFVFVAPDGTRRETRVLVREGEKAQAIRATFDASPEELTPPARAPMAPPPSVTEPKTSSLKMAGYGAAGVGVVGLGIGAAFGISAIAKKGDATCDSNGACDDGRALEDARSAATVATVGVAAGAVLVAAGVTLILLSPSSSPARVTARVAPVRGGAGLGFAW